MAKETKNVNEEKKIEAVKPVEETHGVDTENVQPGPAPIDKDQTLRELTAVVLQTAQKAKLTLADIDKMVNAVKAAYAANATL